MSKKKQEINHTLEFVSYDGRFPNLCSGILVLRLDGELITFKSYSLCSGGSGSFDKDWNEEVTDGSWYISEFPKKFPKELQEQAVKLVNDNVPWGRCDGCV